MDVFVIAEAGVNHNGSLETARKLVDVAAEAGADAVKFQTFVADRVASATSPKAEYQAASVGRDRSQVEMLRDLELDPSAYRDLAGYCEETGIEFLSSPFDRRSASFLADELGVSRLKVPSGEITNGPLLLHLADTGLSVILSTGMSTLDEVEQALGVLAFGYTAVDREPSRDAFGATYASEPGREALERNVTILQCTSSYPCPVDEVNLRVLDTLREAFGLPVGLSDHTRGTEVPVAAVGRGAVVIEKHFTLDPSMEGPDHAASLEPEELERMVDGIRTATRSLGAAEKQPTPSERPNREVARRSLTAARSIEAGETFTEENVTAKRPGSGLTPMRYWEILDKTADRAYEPDELLA